MNLKQLKDLANKFARNKKYRRRVLINTMRADVQYRIDLMVALERAAKDLGYTEEVASLTDNQKLLLAAESLDASGAHGFFVHPI